MLTIKFRIPRISRISAAEQGSPLSQFRVAQLYADIDVNYNSNNAIEAYKRWTIAASFGDPEALQARDRFAKRMDSADIMRGAELARKWE